MEEDSISGIPGMELNGKRTDEALFEISPNSKSEIIVDITINPTDNTAVILRPVSLRYLLKNYFFLLPFYF